MADDKQKTFKSFLPKHILHTMYWLLPLTIICFSRSFFVGITFLSVYTSFTFIQWTKFSNPKRLRIHQVSKLIEGGYYISTAGFLFLTGLFVYKGLVNNYVTQRGDELFFGIYTEHFYCFLYSAFITVVLATITYMIKTGRRWGVLFWLYLLFDVPAVMPFNFLHFYEQQKVQSRLDIDKKLVEDIKLNCDSIIKPEFDNVKTSLYNLNQQQTQNMLSFQAEQSANEKTANSKLDVKLKAANLIEDPQDRAAALRNIPNSITVKPAKFKIDTVLTNRLSKASADSSRFAFLNSKLSATDSLILALRSSKDREQQLGIVEKIKSLLKDVCNSSGNILLQTRAKELLPNEPTQIESLEALYNFVGKNVFSLSDVEETDPKTKKLILMSLIPSIVIDLLPLLFSIVYAWWNRNGDEIF